MNKLKKLVLPFAASLLFIVVLFAFVYYEIQSELFLGLLGSIAAIYFGALKVKIEDDRMFKELFEYFNDKYDTRFNDLINTLKSCAPERRLEDDERNLIIDYFNLSAEEYLWYSRGRIPSGVWKAWEAGIIENLQIQCIKLLYETETRSITGKASFYGMYEALKGRLAVKNESK